MSILNEIFNVYVQFRSPNRTPRETTTVQLGSKTFGLWALKCLQIKYNNLRPFEQCAATKVSCSYVWRVVALFVDRFCRFFLRLRVHCSTVQVLVAFLTDDLSIVYVHVASWSLPAPTLNNYTEHCVMTKLSWWCAFFRSLCAAA